MANASTTGYGFRSVMATGSTPATQGQASTSYLMQAVERSTNFGRTIPFH